MDEVISEKDWEARYDAESLIRIEKIKSDPERYKKAKEAASKLLIEKQEDVRLTKKVAKQTIIPKKIVGSKVKKINPFVSFNVFKRI